MVHYEVCTSLVILDMCIESGCMFKQPNMRPSDGITSQLNYIEERPLCPIQSPNKGRKYNAKG